jgi:hypothetical protein
MQQYQDAYNNGNQAAFSSAQQAMLNSFTCIPWNKVEPKKEGQAG